VRLTPYPNLLMAVFPDRQDMAWTSDFTYLRYRERWLYLATIMDLFTRTIVGLRMLTVHTVSLTLGALQDAFTGWSEAQHSPLRPG